MIEVLRVLALTEGGFIVGGTLLYLREWTRTKSHLLKVRILSLTGFALQSSIAQLYLLHTGTHWYGLPLTITFMTGAIVGLFGPMMTTGWRARPFTEWQGTYEDIASRLDPPDDPPQT